MKGRPRVANKMNPIVEPLEDAFHHAKKALGVVCGFIQGARVVLSWIVDTRALPVKLGGLAC